MLSEREARLTKFLLREVLHILARYDFGLSVKNAVVRELTATPINLALEFGLR